MWNVLSLEFKCTFCQINEKAYRKERKCSGPLRITVEIWSQRGATCTYSTFYIFLTAKASGIMMNHGSHVQRHLVLFIHVMHVIVHRPAIHLPLEFKEKTVMNGSPWVLVSHTADKERTEALKCFSGESVTKNQRLWDPKWAWNWEKKNEMKRIRAKQTAWAIQNMTLANGEWG